MAKLKLSIVFESGTRIGPGKASLLESIRDTGSISAAARDMGMSYKRAWLLLDSINQAFAEPVVTAATGGSGGGGAILTAFGVELLERYRRMDSAAAAATADDVAALERVALVPGRSALLRIGLPMGAESLVGAATGGAFAGSTSAVLLTLLLGIILIAAAAKAFWRRGH